MIRVYVIVEGPTEESFINGVLAPIFWGYGVLLIPTIVGVPGQKGGRTNYPRVKKDIVVQLKQDRAAYCSTMLDFYGLGHGFPGFPIAENIPNIERAARIESAVKKALIEEFPELRVDIRFVPYIQMHEYEGLLFSDPTAFAGGIHQPHLAERFQAIRRMFPTPEDINDDASSAPSKRVVTAHPSYRKVIDGVLAARAVGVESMRNECPHFRNWLEQLATLRMM